MIVPMDYRRVQIKNLCNSTLDFFILLSAMTKLPLSALALTAALGAAIAVSGCKKQDQQQANQPQQQQQQNGQQPQQYPNQTATANQPAAAPSSGGGAAPSTAAPSTSTPSTPAPAPVYTIPAGTRIRVSLGQTLSSKTSQEGEPFSATVTSPVVVDGKEVIHAGASASGTVVEAKPLGRFKGGAVLAVRLDSVRANGRTYEVATSTIERAEKGKGKRTATMVGGGAGLGALIGGLAGGGKGALIGGLAGAGAGTAGSAFTGNKDLVLPAETALTFRLTHAVTVK